MTLPLTDDQIAQACGNFAQDGFVLLRGVFTDYVAGLRAAMADNQARPSWRQRTYQPDGDAAPFFQDYGVWNQFDGYRALVRDSCMAELAARLMDSQSARIFHDHVLLKFPGTSVATPWHQDAPYYLVESPKTCSFWVACDPVPRERSIEYIAGSHLWGQDYKPQRFDGTDLIAGDTREAVPDVNANRAAFDIRGFDVQPGDAVAFDFRTLHGAPANASDTPRRVTSIRWVGDGAVFRQRAGPTSPAFPDLDYEDGEVFEGDLFPLFYDARQQA